MKDLLKKLQELNQELTVYGVDSPEFSAYGRVLAIDTQEIVRKGQAVGMPEQGVRYVPSLEVFEALPITQELRREYYGTLPIQVGYCYGYNSYMNATEWHTASEINIAVTPIVLILGLRSDIKDNRLDSATMKAFYVPKGTAVEVYATSTHYTPCQAEEGGFGCVVVLPQGTNLPLNEKCKDPLLTAQNKWLLAHEENETLLARGVFPGVYGKNYKINY